MGGDVCVGLGREGGCRCFFLHPMYVFIVLTKNTASCRIHVHIFPSVPCTSWETCLMRGCVEDKRIPPSYNDSSQFGHPVYLGTYSFVFD